MCTYLSFVVAEVSSCVKTRKSLVPLPIFRHIDIPHMSQIRSFCKAECLSVGHLESYGLFAGPMSMIIWRCGCCRVRSSGTHCVAIDDVEDSLVGNIAILTRCTTAKLLLQLISGRWTESANGFCSDLAGRVVVVLRVSVRSYQASCRNLMAAQMRRLTTTWHTVALGKEVHGFLNSGRI
jgi:hypothetical protein